VHDGRDADEPHDAGLALDGVELARDLLDRVGRRRPLLHRQEGLADLLEAVGGRLPELGELLPPELLHVELLLHRGRRPLGGAATATPP